MAAPATFVYSPAAHPSTPLRRKAARLAGQPSPQSFDISANSPVHNRSMLSMPVSDALLSSGSSRTPSSARNNHSATHGPSPGRVNRSLQLLESEAHAVRLDSRAKEEESKATPKTYGRHFNAYQVWWGSAEAAKVLNNPTLVALPALPIIAAKVAMFLQYETTREKKKRGTTDTIAGSSIGKSQISQVISALEDYRRNSQHLYTDCAEAQLSLRNDSRIRQFEASARHDEPNRAAKAQVTKAAGSSSDTYTADELRKCARWCFAHFSGPKYIYLGLRDRSMLLLGAATAFRGDSARILLWSDLFKTSLPLGDDIDVPVLGALADNAKHNQTGRLDEHGALRHKHVELCGIGAVAIMFFAYFHIAGYPVPDFAPDFKDKNYGEYGRRDWYTYHVFSTGVGTTEMSYQAHHDRVMQMHTANDISITKVTHGTRPFAAQTARSFGASVSDTKALGGWNDSGSFKNCYDRAMPVGALLGAAFLNSTKPKLYRVGRDSLDPPEQILTAIFPWVEQEQEALIKREHGNHLAKDIALRQFLGTLTWFRHVLVQDVAVLYTQTPPAPIFKAAPFNSTIFREFAAESTAAIHSAEEAARLAFQNLPEHLVASMRGALATQNLGFERERHGYKMQMEVMQTQLDEVKSLLRVVAGSKGIKKAHDSLNGSLSTSSWAVEDTSQMSLSNFPPTPYASTSSSGLSFDPLSPDFQFLEGFGLNDGSSLVFDPPAFTAPPSPQFRLPYLPALSVEPVVHTAALLQHPHNAPGSPEERQQYYFQRYGMGRFQKHSPEWLNGDWVPHYKYASAEAIWDYWVEWKEGVDGFLGVEELTTTWGAKWRRNNPGLKSENTRRMRVINLILELSKKPNWSIKLVQRFITEKYASFFRARAFADFLSKSRAAVITAANSYP